MNTPGQSPVERTGGERDPVVVLTALTGPASITGWCDRVRALLSDGSGTVVCDVAGIAGSAYDVVNTLACMQLTALRCGGSIELHRAQPALLTLLEVLGFAEVLPVVNDPDACEDGRLPIDPPPRTSP